MVLSQAVASTEATPLPSSPSSTTIVADRFSMTDDIKCFELVNLGDDYEAHLQFVHNVTKNFSFYMSKALEQKKF